ncbi:MAG: PEGA domain-containing protein, partial [Pseudomonadota bacterium]|nr:PEGA domain-containing protein [Pseudomonadota bacterium]
AAVVAVPVAPLPAPPPPAEPAPTSRDVWLLVSSDPAGAEVVFDGAVLGVTPLARRLDVGLETTTRAFVVRREGYVDQPVDIDLSAEQATADVHLQRVPAPRTTKGAKVAPAADGGAPTLTAIVADGVRFTGPEAAAAGRFINTATHGELLGAGIAPRQVSIILERRPFSDVAALAETPFIGDKTLESIRGAARKGL